MLQITEGSTVEVPGGNFNLRLDRFTTEMYETGGVKDWKSRLTVVEAGQAVLTKTIEVNHPLSYKGFMFYQSQYGWDWMNPTFGARPKTWPTSAASRSAQAA